MNFLHAAVLGLVQGLGEFLPISSSAHLVLVPWLFKWDYQGLDYDVALHLGTLVAVCAYFWKDWLELLKAGLSTAESAQKRIFWAIVLATVPGGVVGVLLEHRIEENLHSPVIIAATLAAFGLLLGLSQRLGRQDKSADGPEPARHLPHRLRPGLGRGPGSVAFGQHHHGRAPAGPQARGGGPVLLPPDGAHRARRRDPEAAQYPAVPTDGPFWFGILVTTIVGLGCIKFMLSFLKRRGVGFFVAYRVLFAALCIIWALH